MQCNVVQLPVSAPDNDAPCDPTASPCLELREQVTEGARHQRDNHPGLIYLHVVPLVQHGAWHRGMLALCGHSECIPVAAALL